MNAKPFRRTIDMPAKAYDLFRSGLDTYDIGLKLGIDEWEAHEYVTLERYARTGAVGPYPIIPNIGGRT